MEDAYPTPGYLIKLARMQAGFKRQKELAEQANIPVPSMSLLENDRRPPSEKQIEKLVEALPDTLDVEQLRAAMEAHSSNFPKQRKRNKDITRDELYNAVIGYNGISPDDKEILIALLKRLDRGGENVG